MGIVRDFYTPLEQEIIKYKLPLFYNCFPKVVCLISRARKKTVGISRLLAKPFVALHIHPTAVSLLAIPLALISAWFVFKSDFLLSFLFAFLAILIDLFDGEVARVSGKVSLFGNYIEGMIDKTVDFILIGSFVFLFPFETAFALGCSFLASFAKPRLALVIITDNRDWPGLGERGDKMAVLLAGLFAASFMPILFGVETMRLALYLLAFIALIGAIQRIFYAKSLIGDAEEKGTMLPYLKEQGKR